MALSWNRNRNRDRNSDLVELTVCRRAGALADRAGTRRRAAACVPWVRSWTIWARSPDVCTAAILTWRRAGACVPWAVPGPGASHVQRRTAPMEAPGTQRPAAVTALFPGEQRITAPHALQSNATTVPSLTQKRASASARDFGRERRATYVPHCRHLHCVAARLQPLVVQRVLTGCAAPVESSVLLGTASTGGSRTRGRANASATGVMKWGGLGVPRQEWSRRQFRNYPGARRSLLQRMRTSSRWVQHHSRPRRRRRLRQTGL